jgi:hypothetical protein
MKRSPLPSHFELVSLNHLHIMRSSPHVLRHTFRRLGIQAVDTVLLEEVISVQQERSRTLKETATNSRLFFVREVEMDPKAGARHLTPRRMARCSSRLAIVWLLSGSAVRRASTRCSMVRRKNSDRRSARWHSQCGSPFPAAGSHRPSTSRSRLEAAITRAQSLV